MVEAQPVRLDEGVAGGQIVRRPVVEPPVADARHLAPDRQQVHGPQRDPGSDDAGEPDRESPGASSAGSIPDAMSGSRRPSPADRRPARAGRVAVLLTHVAIYSGLVAAGGTAARYAQRLEVGVAIFFVISGFVLYRPFLLARLEGAGSPRRRRAMRAAARCGSCPRTGSR